MKRLTVISLVAVLAAAFTSAALAKGPSAARVDGPGLKGGAIVIKGFGEPGSPSALGQLVEGGGFFAAMFGQTPDPMLTTRPSGDLGPRYRVTFTVPGPTVSPSTIVQDVYPYAPQPTTYTKPGQPFWDGQRTYGGWFLGTPALKQTLVAAGLPKTEPGAGGDWSWPLTTLASIGAAVLLAAILLYLRRRLQSTASRRPHAV